MPTLLSNECRAAVLAGPSRYRRPGGRDHERIARHQHQDAASALAAVLQRHERSVRLRSHAPKPRRWLDFLNALWPQEPDAIDVLGEWFGYVVSGRLDLHKILLMVGPTRGGKGVIARVLSAMIGKRNVCGPTLNSLGGDFGLAPLIGKSLAVISDARFVGKNSGIVVERLLSISGEDTLTVNIKYQRAMERQASMSPARNLE